MLSLCAISGREGGLLGSGRPMPPRPPAV